MVEFCLSSTDRRLDREDYPIFRGFIRAYMLEQGGNWDNYLLLIEFTYNKKFHLSVRMAPFEALHSRRYIMPLCWCEFGESVVLRP